MKQKKVNLKIGEYVFNSNQSTAKILSILSVLLMLICYFAIPFMN